VAVLTATTGLADELAFAFARLGDGFAIRDLRRAGVGFHLEFAQKAVADDFQVKLTHARDDQLAGFLVRETTERRIFFRETLQPFGHLVAIRLLFGSTAMLMTGSGKVGGSSVTSKSSSHSVSPVVMLRRPTSAAMSPEYTESMSLRSLPGSPSGG
jgi:hypothetical protein